VNVSFVKSEFQILIGIPISYFPVKHTEGHDRMTGSSFS